MNFTLISNTFSNFLALNASEIVAVCALFVAVLAFLATVWQGAISRQHARLSVRPHLDRHETRTSTEPLEICIVNNGLGPAIIDHVLVGIFGSELRAQDEAYQSALLNEALKFTSDFRFKMITADTPIQVGQSFALVSFDVDINDQTKLQQAIKFLDGFTFEISYNSMYKERFVLRRNAQKPVVLT